MYGPPPDGELCKILTHLDLLSIPQSEEIMSKRLRGIIGCKDKTSCSTVANAVRGVQDIWVMSNGMLWNSRGGMCMVHAPVNTAVVVLCSTMCDRE